MKVLQLVTRNETRGAEIFAAQLAEQLVTRGHPTVQAALFTQRAGCTAIQFEQVQNTELSSKTQGRFRWEVLRNLGALLRSFQPDVVQANGFHALKYAALHRKLHGARWPLIYRNISLASGWVRSSYQRKWGAWLCKSVDFVTSVSEKSAADFAACYSIPASRITTIRRGVDIPDEPDKVRQREILCQLTGWNPTSPIIGHVGGFTEEKNHHLLLDAFRQILDTVPDTKLATVGDGPLRSEIEHRIAQEFAGAAQSLGHRHDVRTLAAAFDVLLLPSKIEGVPGVVLEAAARMVPAVCSDVGGIREATLHEKTGLIVPTNDAASLASSTIRLLRESGVRLKMGFAAREHIRENYSMSRAVDEFEELFAKLIRK